MTMRPLDASESLETKVPLWSTAVPPSTNDEAAMHALPGEISVHRRIDRAKPLQQVQGQYLF